MRRACLLCLLCLLASPGSGEALNAALGVADEGTFDPRVPSGDLSGDLVVIDDLRPAGRRVVPVEARLLTDDDEGVVVLIVSPAFSEGSASPSWRMLLPVVKRRARRARHARRARRARGVVPQPRSP